MDAHSTHRVFTASAAFVLRSAMHTLLDINSQCEQAHQFGDDYSIVHLWNGFFSVHLCVFVTAQLRLVRVSATSLAIMYVCVFS